MRALVVELGMLLTVAACDGTIHQPSAPVVTPEPGPAPCVPVPTAVPKLLRISNYEYRNIVSDLLGAPVDPALFSQWTPIAQVYGFDTMSETRIDDQALEEQLATAEHLAAIAIATPALFAGCPAVQPAQTPVCPLKASYSSVDDFSDVQDRDCWSYRDSTDTLMSFDITQSRWHKLPEENALLWSNGAHPGSSVDSVRSWLAPIDGTLTVSGSFSDADPGGGDGVLVRILRNRNALFSQDIPNGGPAAPFNQTFAVALGDRIDFVVNRKGDASNDTTAFSAQLALKPTPRKQTWKWENCVQPVISRLASRGFRRPVRPDELADYLALFEQNLTDADTAGFAEPVDEALTAVLEAVFLSPSFTFKPELVPGGLDDSERQFGIASRLSLFTRSSIADDATWMLAQNGGLSTPEQIRAEASRLLDANLDAFTMHFGGQWLDYREGPPLGPLTSFLLQESRDMFAAVFSQGMGPEKLLAPGFTIVNGDLAAYYGLPGAAMNGASLRITTDHRGGLLQQGDFLINTANGDDFRRVIHRGLWVLTRLLGRSLPRADPATLEEIAASFKTIDQSLPLPQQMAIHRNNQQRCGGCHNQMDPIGLALENYDKNGQWRDAYADGTPITGDLTFESEPVHDPFELAATINGDPELRTSVATKLFTYGLNRGPLDGERCVAQSIGRPLDGSMPTLKGIAVESLLKALELSDPNGATP
jgi:hypothetical protein